jgi:hypothetical protein
MTLIDMTALLYVIWVVAISSDVSSIATTAWPNRLIRSRANPVLKADAVHALLSSSDKEKLKAIAKEINSSLSATAYCFRYFSGDMRMIGNNLALVYKRAGWDVNREDTQNGFSLTIS